MQDRSRFGSAAKPRRSDVKKISDVKSEPERTETTAEAKKPEPEPVRPRPGKSDKPVDLGKLLDNQITAALATLTFEQFWRCLPVNWRSNIIAAANDRTGSQYRDDEAPAPSPSKWVN